jgi:hypothetical protein
MKNITWEIEREGQTQWSAPYEEKNLLINDSRAGRITKDFEGEGTGKLCHQFTKWNIVGYCALIELETEVLQETFEVSEYGTARKAGAAAKRWLVDQVEKNIQGIEARIARDQARL